MSTPTFQDLGIEKVRFRRRTDGGPIRRFITRSAIRSFAIMPSNKSHHAIPCESFNERLFYREAEIDSDVQLIAPQPHELTYEIKGKIKRYFPDAYLQRRKGKQIVEVKPEKKLSDPALVERFQELKSIYAKCGIVFVVVTDTALRAEPRQSNVARLVYLSRSVVPTEQRQLVTHVLATYGEMKIEQLLVRCEALSVTIFEVLALVGQGILTIDLNSEISEASPVRITKHD